MLVTHNGASWLPDTLKALLTQTKPLDRLVAVDTGDGSTVGMLTEVVGEGNLLTLPQETGFGEAVAQALAHPAASVEVPDVEDATEWVWLVHDDSAPAQNALEHLLATAETHPPAVILGPKQRDWTDRRRLLEAGVAIDRAGRRETGLDRWELDQGQHDTIREVMAVSTAGMLVRRDVWDELDGLDLEFGLFRDDIDFGWRAYAAGHRVLLAPDAVMYHAEASARGIRDSRGRLAGKDRPRRGGEPARSAGTRNDAISRAGADRRNALLVLFANLPPSLLPRSLSRNAFGTALRALLFLAAKRPRAARAEVAAFGGALRAAPRLRRARQHRFALSVVKRFQPRWGTLRRLPDRLRDGLAQPGEKVPRRRGSRSRLALAFWLRRPSVLLTLALAAVALAAGRELFMTGGRLGGGALMPAWGGAGDLWERYISGFHPVGLGSSAGSPPYVAVLAALSTLLLGKPWLAVWALLLGGVPLAGLSAYLVTLRLLPRAGILVAVWAGATYALLPVATGAVTGGRLGTIVVAALLPPIGLFAYRMAEPAARHAAWAAGLLLAIATAFVPLIWLLAALVGLLARTELASWRAGGSSVGSEPNVGRRLMTMLAVPPLLLLPWTLHLVAHPSGLLREAGLSAATGGARPGTLLMLGPGGPGTPVPWITAGLVVTGALALLAPRLRTVVLTGWLLALPGMLVAILVVAASAWPGAALTVAAAGLILAACGMLRQALVLLPGRRRGVWIILARAGAVILLAGAASTPLLAAASWTAAGTGGPLGQPSTTTSLPVFVDAVAARPRVLVLHSASGAVDSTVLRDRLPLPGDEATAAPAAARERLHGVVAALAAGTGPANPLARFGIRFILVPHPAGDPLVRTLDATPDLARLSRTPDFALWQVAAPSGRLLLYDRGTATPLPTGQVGARVAIPPGAAGRALLLAEPADGGWRAIIDGRPVRSRTADGWAQEYDVPAAGGELTLQRDMRGRHLWVGAQAFALALVILLAVPSARWETRRPRGRRRRRVIAAIAAPREPSEAGA